MSRADRRIAGDILGTLVDITNITWTGRFRDLYGFPPEETYQYLLEAGSFISPAARHDLAFAADTGEMILRLPRARLYRAAPGGRGPGGSGDPAPAALDGGPFEKPGAPPFQIGLPITFLFFKELELDNLITLITGMLLDLPSERVAPWLWRRVAGGGHV